MKPELDHRMTAKFEELSARLEELLVLLEDADELLWLRFMNQAARKVRKKTLAGVTYVLGCYGGEDTFSDLVIHPQLKTRDPRRYQLSNKRLKHLRSTIFTLANDIAASSSQLPQATEPTVPQSSESE